MCHVHLGSIKMVFVECVCFLTMVEVAFCSALYKTMMAGGEMCYACLTISGDGALFAFK